MILKNYDFKSVFKYMEALCCHIKKQNDELNLITLVVGKTGVKGESQMAVLATNGDLLSSHLMQALKSVNQNEDEDHNSLKELLDLLKKIKNI